MRAAAYHGVPAVSAAPVVTIKAHRRKGRAIVTVERPGRDARRYCVSLRRYRWLREWTLSKTMDGSSGAWLRGSLTVYLRGKGVHRTM